MFNWLPKLLNRRTDKIIKHKDSIISELADRFPWNSMILSSILPPKDTIRSDDITIGIRNVYRDLIFSTTIEYDDIVSGRVDEIIATSILDVRSDIYDNIIYIDIFFYTIDDTYVSYRFYKVVEKP